RGHFLTTESSPSNAIPYEVVPPEVMLEEMAPRKKKQRVVERNRNPQVSKVASPSKTDTSGRAQDL
ncbi:unnamed protein product, partial [Ilex paraguariensis]